MQNEYVVLLHGLRMHSVVMKFYEVGLKKEGYKILNLDYPSHKYGIHELVDMLKEKLDAGLVEPYEKVHFVTHSMGGIMVRALLDKYELPKLGRIVMLGPPNQGSGYANFWAKTKLANFVMGPALKELNSEGENVPKQLGKIDGEIGVIAGKYDTAVKTHEAKLDEMSDYVIVPTNHSLLLASGKALKFVKKFLKEGKF